MNHWVQHKRKKEKQQQQYNGIYDNKSNCCKLSKLNIIQTKQVYYNLQFCQQNYSSVLGWTMLSLEPPLRPVHHR